ncbi:MAG: hypothetical protein AB4368_23530 [Xenococcaceae cyanobacterium]
MTSSEIDVYEVLMNLLEIDFGNGLIISRLSLDERSYVVVDPKSPKLTPFLKPL